MNYYRHHMGDYFTATRHLTWDQDLAYRRLMEAFYIHEKPLPLVKTKLYAMVSAVTPKHRTSVDEVLAEFFVATEEGYTNQRCEEEVADYYGKKERASESAKQRWDKGRRSEGNASAMRTHSKGNAPTTTPIKKDARANGKGREGKSSSAGSVPVIEGTPAFEAWAKHLGKRPPTTDLRLAGGQIKRGWYFPTEFPPERAAS